MVELTCPRCTKVFVAATERVVFAALDEHLIDDHGRDDAHKMFVAMPWTEFDRDWLKGVRISLD